jgi:hypothetical protein
MYSIWDTLLAEKKRGEQAADLVDGERDQLMIIRRGG